MAEHGFKMPEHLWQRYGQVVGTSGRSADLKTYLDWRIDHPQVELGPDTAEPPDSLHRIKVEETLWAEYAELIPDGKRSADLRSYINWRVANPDTPLPGRRRVSARRERSVGCA